jgi:hypothetical protein
VIRLEEEGIVLIVREKRTTDPSLRCLARIAKLALHAIILAEAEDDDRQFSQASS